MVSLKDIAAACGVSASTVSKALNDLDDISEKRKAMIRQKANEMGYLPNMAARALKTKMTHILLHFPIYSSTLLYNNYMCSCLRLETLPIDIFCASDHFLSIHLM